MRRFYVVLFFILSIGVAQASDITQLELFRKSSIKEIKDLKRSDTDIEEVNLSGSLISIIVDNEKTPEQLYYIRLNDNRTLRLNFKNEIKDIRNVKNLSVKGYKYKNDIAVDSYRVSAYKTKLSDNASTGEASGNQRVLVVPIMPEGSIAFNYSKSELEDLFFSAQTSVKAYYEEVSKSRVTLSGTVAETMVLSGICESSNIISNDEWLYILDNIHRTYDLSNFDRLSVIVPNSSDCLSSGTYGVGTIGKLQFSDITGKVFSISFNFVKAYSEPAGNKNTLIGIAAHELGHNFGLVHDDGNSCGKLIFSTSCSSIEYAGAHSIMGYAPNLAHINTIHKEDLGWLSPSEIVTVSDGESKEVTLGAVSGNDGLPKKIKIQRDDGKYYVIEYAQPVNIAQNQAFPRSVNYSGFLVYLNEPLYNSDSVLLSSNLNDIRTGLQVRAGKYFDPEVAKSFSQTAAFNEFFDDTSMISVKQKSISSSSITLEVAKGFDTVIDKLGIKIIGPNIDQLQAGLDSYGFSISEINKYPNIMNKLETIAWDYDGDGLSDYVSDNSYASFIFKKPGVYKLSAKVYISGKAYNLTYDKEIVVVDKLQLSLNNLKNSISSEPHLSTNKKSAYKLNIDFSNYDLSMDGSSAHAVKLYFLNSAFKYIKYSKVPAKLNKNKQAIIPLEFAPGKVFQAAGYSEDADGYYTIPVQVQLLNLDTKSRRYLYRDLKIKAN